MKNWIFIFFSILLTSCGSALTVMGNFPTASTASADSEPSILALNHLKASKGDVVKVVGLNLKNGMFVQVGGVTVPLNVESSTFGSFVMPETSAEGGTGASFFTKGNQSVGTWALVPTDSPTVPVMEVDPAVICSDITYRDSQGQQKNGMRNCAVGAQFCTSEGETSCVTTAAFPSASKAVLQAQSRKIRAGTTLSGVSGTLADCSNDGDVGCVAVGPTFSAALTIGAAAKIVAGQNVAGVTGTAFQAAPPTCTGANQTGCLATATYRTMDLSTAGVASALNATTFATLMSSAGNFEFWDSLGTKYTIAGDSDLVASNLRSGVVLENISLTGTMPAVLPLPPTAVTSAFNTSPDRVVLNWTNMSQAGYLVVMRAGSAPTFNPSRNVTYTSGVQGSDTILYVGSANTYTHTTVSSGTVYHYAVYSYDANHFYSSSPTRNNNSSTLCAGLIGGTWTAVPGDADYGTSDFCVMKYEAKNVGGIPTSQIANGPWGGINQPSAIAACRSLGTNYDLISNHEWLTVASNIASNPINWTSGTIGTGALNIGHSDNSPGSACPASSNETLAFVQNDCTPAGSASMDPLQKRNHILTNGQIIWDLAGNVSEWTSLVLSDNNHKPYRSSDGAPGGADLEFNTIDSDFSVLPYSEIAPTHALKPYWNDSWVSGVQGIGIYNSSGNGSGGVVRRGDAWGDYGRSGVFNIKLDRDLGTAEGYIGFRCTYRP